MGNPKKVESRPEEVPVSHKNGENKIQMLRCELAIELDDPIEGVEGLLGQMGIAIDANDVGKEGWSGGIMEALELRKKVFHEREMAGMAEFEDEGVESGVRMVEIGLARGQIENLLG